MVLQRGNGEHYRYPSGGLCVRWLERYGERLLLGSRHVSVRYNERSDYRDGFVCACELTNTHTDPNTDTNTHADPNTHTDSDSNPNGCADSDTESQSDYDPDHHADANTESYPDTVPNTCITRSAW